MNTSPGRDTREWWIIQERSIYVVAALVISLLVAAAAGAYVWTRGNPFRSSKPEAVIATGARFDFFEGDVRVVRALTREIVFARSDTQLFPGDIVQTQAGGRARITLVDDSTLLVRPNSVVTIRDNARGEGGGRTNVRVAVDTGQVKVRTDQQSEDANNIVETNMTASKLGSKTDASFDVREDKTEDIRVSTGNMQTSTRGGDTTTLNAGEFVSVNSSGKISRRERLLEVPSPSSPRDLEKIALGPGGNANVSLRWQRPQSGNVSHYGVEISTSPFFVAAGKVMERNQLGATDFSIGNLRPGNYFWRVRAEGTTGQISDWCEPQKFVVVATSKGNKVERIQISDVSASYLGGNVYLVRGRSQAGNTVRVAGRETSSARDGSFQIQISVQGDVREVTVEAEDQQGNKNTYRLTLGARRG